MTGPIPSGTADPRRPARGRSAGDVLRDREPRRGARRASSGARGPRATRWQLHCDEHVRHTDLSVCGGPYGHPPRPRPAAGPRRRPRPLAHAVGRPRTLDRDRRPRARPRAVRLGRGHPRLARRQRRGDARRAPAPSWAATRSCFSTTASAPARCAPVARRRCASSSCSARR